jgi:hypothetical protein
MNWDFIIAAVIIIGLVLAIWAKISRQTIPELLSDLKDLATDQKEEQTENMTQVYA